MLCPFSEEYARTWNSLKLLLVGVDKVARGNVELRRVIDYDSPLLVGERLYELARFADQCIVDWTEWRANVFFELGVRLAVNPTWPICVISKAAATSLDDTKKALVELFSPLTYSLEGSDESADADFRDEFDKKVNPDRPLAVSSNSVYSASEANVFLDQEYGHVQFHYEVLRDVEAMIGDLVAQGRLRLLYAGNRHLTRKAYIGMLDSLTAARDLLQRKISWATNDMEKGGFKQALKDVESRLEGMLENLKHDPLYYRYREDVRVMFDDNPR